MILIVILPFWSTEYNLIFLLLLASLTTLDKDPLALVSWKFMYTLSSEKYFFVVGFLPPNMP